MIPIRLNKSNFDSYLKQTEAAFNAEIEIIKDKLKQGINGLEWLVMNVLMDDDRKESLNQFMKLAPLVARGTRNPIELFVDAVILNSDAFYSKHELNWWIAIDETLTYFALLKARDYDSYFEMLNEIQRSMLPGIVVDNGQEQ